MGAPLTYTTFKVPLNALYEPYSNHFPHQPFRGKGSPIFYYRTLLYETFIESCLNNFVYDNIYLFNQDTRIPFDTIYNIVLQFMYISP